MWFPTNRGGIKIANNLAVTEEGFVLDARQGKILNEKIIETKDDLLKMIQASGVLTGNADWNNYMNPGVYKVQNATMTAQYHAPVGVYQYGVLEVLVSELVSEHKTIQIYYPDNGGNGTPIVIRSYITGNWMPWWKISGQRLE